jgi:hypothetical protein
MIVTNTSATPIDIHGTVCSPEASVKITERQWRVFKASVAGARALATKAIKVKTPKAAPAKPAPKPETKAKA